MGEIGYAGVDLLRNLLATHVRVAVFTIVDYHQRSFPQDRVKNRQVMQ